jgi:hypothetical protein
MSTNPKREGNVVKGKFSEPKVRSNFRGGGTVSWIDVDTDVVIGLVRVCTEQGSAVMFGRVSDGGALSVCILDRDEKIKEYPRTADEVQKLLTWLKDDYYGLQ